MGKKQYAYINNEMLVWARLETPFCESPMDVSLHCPEIDATLLDKWEKGEELPTLNEIRQLARLYKVPMACFYLSRIPQKRIAPYTDRRTNLGSVYGKMSYELWSEIRKVLEYQQKAKEYSEDNLMQDRSFPMVRINAGIDECAKSIREYLGLPLSFKNKSTYNNNAFLYFQKIIESKDIIVAQISKVELAEMKGISIYSEEFPIIAINNKDYEGAKVFSLFHEMAHLLRRSSSLCLIDDNERNDEEEKICDRIAAAVLMDETEFRIVAADVFNKYKKWNQISLTRLAERFGVSMVAAFRRLHDLGLITHNIYRALYEQINREYEALINQIMGKRKDKKSIIPYEIRYLSEHGRVFPRVIILAHSTGKITIGEACQVLGVKRKYYDSFERMVML